MHIPGIKCAAADMVESRYQRCTMTLKICIISAALLICVTGVDPHMSTAAAHTRGRHIGEGIEASHGE